MKLDFFLFVACIFISTSVFCQKNKYPKDLSPYCEFAKNKEGKNIVKSRKLPIDLIGAGYEEEYEIISACKDRKKINVIIRYTSTGNNHLLLYTAEKIGIKWEQKVAKNINISNDINMKKKEVIECFFPDMNTLFVAFRLENGEKKAYLIRLTHRIYRVYESSFNPSENSIYYKDEKGSVRPRY